jgi:hypothetical protein
MAFLALASFARRAPIVIPGQFRQFSSVITAGIWNRAPTWAPPPGNHLPALAEQLIDLRRRFSASSAWNCRHSATPVEVGLTPPSSASAERTTGVASIPSGDIELSTGATSCVHFNYNPVWTFQYLSVRRDPLISFRHMHCLINIAAKPQEKHYWH